jgi:hypothetical protein
MSNIQKENKKRESEGKEAIENLSQRDKVKRAYLQKRGQLQPQPQSDLDALYLTQTLAQQQRRRRRVVPHSIAEKKPVDVLRDAIEFLKG